MMKQTLIASAVACAFLAAAAPVMADDAPAPSPLTFNVGVVSDYLFRGVSQTHGDPALQGGADYAFSNGFYVGTWLSTISWVKDYTNKGDVEWDLYGGYRGNFNPDWTYDVGAIAYLYPGHGDATGFGDNPTTTEVRASIGYKWLSVKYSYATSTHFIGWRGLSADGHTDGSDYLEANAAYPLDGGWTITGHIGHQKVKDLSVADYTDWNVGVTKDVGFGVVGLMYSDTNAAGDATAVDPYSWPSGNFVAGAGSSSDYKNVAKNKLVLTFLKTF